MRTADFDADFVRTKQDFRIKSKSLGEWALFLFVSLVIAAMVMVSSGWTLGQSQPEPLCVRVPDAEVCQ